MPPCMNSLCPGPPSCFQELIELQPQLAVAAKETEAAMEVISHESAEADKVKQVCVGRRGESGWMLGSGKREKEIERGLLGKF